MRYIRSRRLRPRRNGGEFSGLLWKGHLRGGPPFFALLLTAVLAACAGGEGPGRPVPSGAVPSRPLEVYRQLGMLTGGSDFPGIATFSTLAGPADSTYLLLGMSLASSALRFFRETAGYRADYTVTLRVLRDGEELRREERQSAVRVPSFEETRREDESVIFQMLLALEPGRYDVEVEVRDGMGSRGFRARDSLEIPAYGVGARQVSPPLLVFEARGRADAESEPDLLLNPRRTTPYGTESPKLYVEGYGLAVDERIVVHVLDGLGEKLWQKDVTLDSGTDELRFAVVEIPSAELPLGTLWLEIDAGPEPLMVGRGPLLVTISDHWMVAQFDDLLRLLAYIADPAEVDSLAGADGALRRELWERFWQRRDTGRAGGVNEFRDQFFERVRTATHQFAEPGRAGWDTERGEVYIVLGPPDGVIERPGAREGLPQAMDWVYNRTLAGRIVIVFVDVSGLGHFEMTPASRNSFRSLSVRMRPG